MINAVHMFESYNRALEESYNKLLEENKNIDPLKIKKEVIDRIKINSNSGFAPAEMVVRLMRNEVKVKEVLVSHFPFLISPRSRAGQKSCRFQCKSTAFWRRC